MGRWRLLPRCSRGRPRNSSKIQCGQENSGAGQLRRDGRRLGPARRRKCPGAFWHDPPAEAIALTSPAGSHARADRLRIAPFTSDEEALSPGGGESFLDPARRARGHGWAGRSAGRSAQLSNVRPPSQPFVHALRGACHGNRCMNGPGCKEDRWTLQRRAHIGHSSPIAVMRRRNGRGVCHLHDVVFAAVCGHKQAC